VQNTNNTDYFGIVVKTARQKKRITQLQLAESLSISTRYLKAIENSGKKPSYELLVRIIEELDISANELLHPEQKDASAEFVPL